MKFFFSCYLSPQLFSACPVPSQVSHTCTFTFWMTTLYWSGNKIPPNLNPLQAFPLSWQLWEIIQKNGKLFGWGEACKSVSLKRTSPIFFHFSSLTELLPFQKLTGPILGGKKRRNKAKQPCPDSHESKGASQKLVQWPAQEPWAGPAPLPTTPHHMGSKMRCGAVPGPNKSLHRHL